MEKLENSIEVDNLNLEDKTLIDNYFNYIKVTIDILKSKSRYGNYSSTFNKKLYNDYISNVIKNLWDIYDIKEDIIVNLEDKKKIDCANYLSLEVSINSIIEDKVNRELSFNMNELFSNCSSMVVRNINDSYFFKDQIMFDLFMYAINELIFNVFKYSSILYTISAESFKFFRTYCDNNTKIILEFNNKRNSHLIKYCNLLDNIDKKSLKHKLINKLNNEKSNNKLNNEESTITD